MMIERTNLAWLIVALVHFAVMIRAVVIAGRDPYARAAWLLLLFTLPFVGVVLYFLFGETWISRGGTSQVATDGRRTLGLRAPSTRRCASDGAGW